MNSLQNKSSNSIMMANQSTALRSKALPLPSLPSSGKRKRKVSWLVYACLTPFAILLLFACWLGIKEFQTSRLLQSELQDLARRGSPIDNPSMQRWFDASTHKEGTEAWLELLRLASASNQLAPDLPFVGIGYVPTDVTPGMEWPSEPRVAEFLDLHEPMFKKITEAGQFPKPIWLPTEWKGVDTLLPELQESTSVVRLLELKALHSLWKKDTQGALDALKSIKETADAFDIHSCVIADLVCIAERGSLYRMVNRSLGMDVWSESELDQLEELVRTTVTNSNAEFVKSWEETFSGERAMALTLRGREFAFNSTGSSVLRYIPIFPSDTRRIIQYYQGLIDLGKGGIAGLLERSKKQGVLFESELQKLPSASSFILGVMAPAIEAYSQAVERHYIARQVTLTSIAIKRFQRKNGKFPETLSQLGSPDWPIPEWNVNGRKPLVYRVTDGVATLYHPVLHFPTSNAPLEPSIDPFDSKAEHMRRVEFGSEVMIR